MQGCYNYLKTHKLQTESSYPWVGYQKGCAYNAASGVVSTTGYVDVTKNSASAHMSAIQNGPVSIAINAESSSF